MLCRTLVVTIGVAEIGICAVFLGPPPDIGLKQPTSSIATPTVNSAVRATRFLLENLFSFIEASQSADDSAATFYIKNAGLAIDSSCVKTSRNRRAYLIDII